DVDIKKPDAGDRRPDIVFHRRGTHEDNFLVIEVKRDNQRAITGELEKIERYWFAEPYLYQFGAALNLNSDFTYQVETRVNPKNPKNTRYTIQTFHVILEIRINDIYTINSIYNKSLSP